MSQKRLSPPHESTGFTWYLKEFWPSPGSLLLLLSCCVAIVSCCSACQAFGVHLGPGLSPGKHHSGVYLFISTRTLWSLYHIIFAPTRHRFRARSARLRGDFSSLQWKRLRGAQGVLLFVRRMTLRLPSGGSGPMGSQCLLPTFLFSSSP